MAATLPAASRTPAIRSTFLDMSLSTPGLAPTLAGHNVALQLFRRRPRPGRRSIAGLNSDDQAVEKSCHLRLPGDQFGLEMLEIGGVAGPRQQGFEAVWSFGRRERQIGRA